MPEIKKKMKYTGKNFDCRPGTKLVTRAADTRRMTRLLDIIAFGGNTVLQSDAARPCR